MTRNIKLTIEYDGTDYCGWQVQNGRLSLQKAGPPAAGLVSTEGGSAYGGAGRWRSRKRSIQEVIETTLERVLQEKVRIAGSGRTDAGVHARGQVANFHTRSAIPAANLQRALNALLPKDIVIIKAVVVGGDFHSRFSAVSKIYRYTVLNRRYPSALLRRTAYQYSYPLDLALMRREARCLIGRHDFKSFCVTSAKKESTVRTIGKIKIADERDLIYITIQADGFLYNMMRSIAGTLLEIGRGKLATGSLRAILAAKDRRKAGPTAPAHGLCLESVQY